MKLELEQKDVEKILLEWAGHSFPGAFDTVRIESGYSSFKCAVFTKEKADATTE